jgi:outer membrane lipoprotein carrier protein
MRAFAFLVFLAVGPAIGAETPDLAPVKKWIAQQQDVRSIEADFVQTRALRTLRSPVTAKGRFWFRAPDKFRWQIGDPPKTVVISTGKNVWVIQPGKKTAEKSAPGKAGGQAQGFTMMNLPMAGDFETFQRSFEVFSITMEGARCRLEGLPRDAQARRFLSKIVIDFDTKSGKMLGFEAVTKEGSSMRNDFQNVVVNGKIAPTLFDYDLTGYKVKNATP